MNNTAILIDDEVDGLGYLERLIGFCEDIQVVAKTVIPEEGIELILELKPDILFLDVEMPRISGFELLEIIRDQGVNPVVIFTTGYSQYAIKAIKAKAFDYLLKPIVFDELKETLRKIEEDKKEKNINISNAITDLLSPRETEVLDYIIKGMTSKEIANALFISKTTVDTHRRNILDKTGLSNTTELLIKILEHD